MCVFRDWFLAQDSIDAWARTFGSSSLALFNGLAVFFVGLLLLDDDKTRHKNESVPGTPRIAQQST